MLGGREVSLFGRSGLEESSIRCFDARQLERSVLRGVQRRKGSFVASFGGWKELLV